MDGPDNIPEGSFRDDIDYALMSIGWVRMIKLCQVNARDDEDDKAYEGDTTQQVGQRVGVFRNGVSQALETQAFV